MNEKISVSPVRVSVGGGGLWLEAGGEYAQHHQRNAQTRSLDCINKFQLVNCKRFSQEREKSASNQPGSQRLGSHV
jgi:hypothetical protein